MIVVRDEGELKKGGVYPKGYAPLRVGYLAFTLFFDNGSGYASGRAAPVPVTLWFRPQSSEDARCIPSDRVEEIRKLPPRKRDTDPEKTESQKRPSSDAGEDG
jgi:hypothetical protein